MSHETESKQILWTNDEVSKGIEEVKSSEYIILDWITEILNHYHRISKSRKYWDLLLGDWLIGFSHSAYSVWVSSNIHTSSNNIIPVSIDTSSQSALHLTPEYHHHLHQLKHLWKNGKLATVFEFSESEVNIANRNAFSKAQKIIQKVSTNSPKVLMTSPYYRCSRTEWSTLLVNWRKWLAWDELLYPFQYSTSIDKFWRLDIARNSNRGGFKEFLKFLLPLHIPVVLLEGFHEFRKAVLSFPVNRPAIMYSANALHHNLVWKLLAAEWKERGTRILYHQHGGGYGIDRLHTPEDYEVRNADRYFTWGWKRAEGHVAPLSPTSINLKKNDPKNILLCCVNFPPVTYRVHFHPMPGNIESMYSETNQLLEKLKVLPELTIRPYFDDYNSGFLTRMKQVAPESNFDNTTESIFSQFAKSKLIIHNYLGTSWLETIALNIPTICLYQPNIYSFREPAQKYIHDLEKVGVMHRDAASAASFILGIKDNIESWWNQTDVQQACKNFKTHYANFSENWKSEWKKEFERAIDEADE